MKWYGLCLLATFAALCLLEKHTTFAAPSPRSDDLLKTLQDLEQIYSSMARPRFGKRDRILNKNDVFENSSPEYTDVQSNDDGNVPVIKWGVGGLASDAEMKTDNRMNRRSGNVPTSMRQHQLQQLQHLYQNQFD